MFNVESGVISVEYWETGIKKLLEFDSTLSVSESVVEEDAYNGYTSLVDKLICQYTSPRLCPHTAVRCILDEVKSIYRRRGLTCDYQLQRVSYEEIIAVLTYQS